MTSSNGNIFCVSGPLWGEGQWRGALMFIDLRLNKQSSKQSRPWWFEPPSPSLWRHSNGFVVWSTFLKIILSFSFRSLNQLSSLTGMPIDATIQPYLNGIHYILQVVNNKLHVLMNGRAPGPTGLILYIGLHPAIKRRRYKVSLIGLAQT